MTHDPLYGSWIRGRLALAGLTDPRIPIPHFLDAVYVSLIEAPTEMLKRLEDHLVVSAAAADPEGARKTWGLLPEHQIRTPLEQVTLE